MAFKTLSFRWRCSQGGRDHRNLNILGSFRGLQGSRDHRNLNILGVILGVYKETWDNRNLKHFKGRFRSLQGAHRNLKNFRGHSRGLQESTDHRNLNILGAILGVYKGTWDNRNLKHFNGRFRSLQGAHRNLKLFRGHSRGLQGSRG